MISYNWGSRETVLKIRDRLKSAGFNYWIDIENMSTYQHFVRNLPNITSYPLPYSDITSSIKKHLFTRWQHLWHNSTSNKLHNIYPTIPTKSKYPKAQLTRQEQTLYNRLRIGHTYLTHSYLLKDEDPPICIPCNNCKVYRELFSVNCRAYTHQLY